MRRLWRVAETVFIRSGAHTHTHIHRTDAGSGEAASTCACASGVCFTATTRNLVQRASAQSFDPLDEQAQHARDSDTLETVTQCNFDATGNPEAELFGVESRRRRFHSLLLDFSDRK